MGYYYYYYNDKHPEEASNLEVLSELLGSVENEIVEFKAASNGFDFHKLGQYFSAISNEARINRELRLIIMVRSFLTTIRRWSRYSSTLFDPLGLDEVESFFKRPFFSRSTSALARLPLWYSSKLTASS